MSHTPSAFDRPTIGASFQHQRRSYDGATMSVSVELAADLPDVLGTIGARY